MTVDGINSVRPARWACVLIGCLALGLDGGRAWGVESPWIRLRNELMVTSATAPPAVPGPQTLEVPVSGLYLVQFQDSCQPAWRQAVRAAGVDLLEYVPDNAFVARFQRVNLKSLRALPFLRYVGPYRPDHKVRVDLTGARWGTGERRAVRVLLTPEETGASLRPLSGRARLTRSRAGNAMEVEATPAELEALAQSASVLWIEPALAPRLYDEAAAKIVGGPNPTNGHATATQAAGFDGGGVKVAVVDSGLCGGTADSVHLDLRGRVDAFYYYGGLTSAVDEDGHGTHTAGIIAGNGATAQVDAGGFLYGLGLAPGARLIVQRIFDAEGAFQRPDSNETLTRDAVRAGATIGSNSWGADDQGYYDTTAAEFDALVRDADNETPGDQPLVLEFSAGNAGHGARTIGSPAVAKNVIATGALQSNRRTFPSYPSGPEAMADFSSRGPCEDGRIKPDLAAPGTWIASLRSYAAPEPDAQAAISPHYQYMHGTSQAGAMVSAAAAVFVQYYRSTHQGATPSPALVKAALINTAIDVNSASGTNTVPDFDQGWGRVNVAWTAGSTSQYEWLDQSFPLATGEVFEHALLVRDNQAPLRLTMAYTDVRGFAGVIPALVNDLDLELEAPDGRLYRGNQFANGESVPDAAASDTLNNVEGICLREPLAGEYRVRVRGRNVVSDARSDSAAIDQDFALAVQGHLAAPGYGVLTLDRAVYTAPSAIHLKLIDADLAGQATVAVQLASSTRTNPLTVTLTAQGTQGVFTGAVSTARAGAAADVLPLSQGDQILARYQDARPAGWRTASAQADLNAPRISQLQVTNWQGLTVISWLTDEATQGTVYYGSNMSSPLTVAEDGWTQTHRVILANLPLGVTNLYWLAVSDPAGNVVTNNNLGSGYLLEPSVTPTVLLVNDYPADDLTANVPLNAYTDALDGAQTSYQVWDVAVQGRYPTCAELRAYRVTIWRLNDSIALSAQATNSIAPAEQATLMKYLAEGGSLFIASMELLQRLGTERDFQTRALHVQSFTPDTGASTLLGVDGDPIGANLNLTLDYSAFPAWPEAGLGPDFSDTIQPTADAAPILLSGATGECIGLRYPSTGQDSTGRVIFLSFPLEAIPLSGETPNDRASLMRRALGFLSPGVNNYQTVALDRNAYTIPSRATAEVTDASLAGQGQTTARFYSDTDTNGCLATLFETVRKGVFRGGVTLISAATAASEVAPGQLRCADGGTLTVQYPAGGDPAGFLYATAGVDTQTPAISAVTATALYETATLSWTTSKNTDALAQFGDSSFLGRTAYAAEAATYHELHLSGLQPGKAYYFQVASRDVAGNQAVDNNGGKFYSFVTRSPLLAPWSDDLEAATNVWSVQTDVNSAARWQLGAPTNDNGTIAHSGTNAWGSNLWGESPQTGDTRLVSPALRLTGGTVATLSFWHNYDFAGGAEGDGYEWGQVQISTDNGASWQPLATLSGASAGWERTAVDLTVYLGQVVRVGWYYALFAYTPLPRPGWLLDDVSVSVVNTAYGVVAVSNNLSQARFTVSGPVTLDGQGTYTEIGGAPVGSYVVTFQPVPYYATPAPLTNTLSATHPLLFVGRYTFADTNHNGIPDLWEREHFGSVAAAAQPDTDTDGDGLSDAEEFLAGTDPTNALSRLQVASPIRLTGGTLRVSAATVPGRSYRASTSLDGTRWYTEGEWRRASGSRLSFVLTPTNRATLFRVEVQP